MVHPSVPIGRDVGRVVIVAILVGEDDPAIAQEEIIIVLVIFVAVLVFANQLSVLDLVVANEFKESSWVRKKEKWRRKVGRRNGEGKEEG